MPHGPASTPTLNAGLRTGSAEHLAELGIDTATFMKALRPDSKLGRYAIESVLAVDDFAKVQKGDRPSALSPQKSQPALA